MTVKKVVEKKVIKKEAFNGNGLRFISYKLFTYECESVEAVSAKGFFREGHALDFGILPGAAIICTSEKQGKSKIVVAL